MIYWAARSYGPQDTELLSFIHALQAAQTDAKSRAKRGPFLAELEYEFLLLSKQNDKVGRKSRMSALLCKFFDRFGGKPCCYDDMKKYAFGALSTAN